MGSNVSVEKMNNQNPLFKTTYKYHPKKNNSVNLSHLNQYNYCNETKNKFVRNKKAVVRLNKSFDCNQNQFGEIEKIENSNYHLNKYFHQKKDAIENLIQEIEITNKYGCDKSDINFDADNDKKVSNNLHSITYYEPVINYVKIPKYKSKYLDETTKNKYIYSELNDYKDKNDKNGLTKKLKLSSNEFSIISKDFLGFNERAKFDHKSGNLSNLTFGKYAQGELKLSANDENMEKLINSHKDAIRDFLNNKEKVSSTSSKFFISKDFENQKFSEVNTTSTTHEDSFHKIDYRKIRTKQQLLSKIPKKSMNEHIKILKQKLANFELSKGRRN